MNETNHLNHPNQIDAILKETQALGFDMASEPLTGVFLRTLTASKPGGRFLEIGTGTGLSAAWLLDGMDESSTLLTVDNDPAVTAVAEKYLGSDPRVTVVTKDGALLLKEIKGEWYDLIFVDSWPGKYNDLDLALNLLEPGED